MEFVQALIFNYLIGAPDAHAKNYSVMHAPGLTRITPMYDVASALPYEADGVTELATAAMKIGGQKTSSALSTGATGTRLPPL